MTWTYFGDPSESDVSLYRFHIGDTLESEPVLTDEEIEYILNTYSIHNERLYYLFDAAATSFARTYRRSLGPQSEDPTSRLKYFEEKAVYYNKLITRSGISLPKRSSSIFTKGMHDNV